MAIRRTPFVLNEWYHCYTRGVDKRMTFQEPRDYERFMQTLYLCNDVNAVHRDNLRNKSKEHIFQIPHESPLVAVGVYCLIPNHFHLLLKEIRKNGITRFMHKIGTAYTMYFNLKHERIGSLFVKPFRSKHINKDDYFRQVGQYIHLNSVELFEPGWKYGKVRHAKQLEKKLISYPYSSCGDYYGAERLESAILDKKSFESMYDELPPLTKVLEETQAYYQELRW